MLCVWQSWMIIICPIIAGVQWWLRRWQRCTASLLLKPHTSNCFFSTLESLRFYIPMYNTHRHTCPSWLEAWFISWSCYFANIILQICISAWLKECFSLLSCHSWITISESWKVIVCRLLLALRSILLKRLCWRVSFESCLMQQQSFYILLFEL